MTSKPDIPKRLASRIRAAQERVRQKRLAVANSEHTLRRSLGRIAEFERDQEAFADRYYRGHGADSYPVRTTITREQERIEYHENRKPKRIEELAELGRDLQRIEEEVLREVSDKQPYKGRVLWPPALPAFAAFKAAFDADERLQDRADAAEHERFINKREEDDCRRIENKIREEPEIDALIAGLPERERVYLSGIRNGIKEGKFTFLDFIGALDAKKSL